MPRGSKPGERRGGRAKGTKNKRTEKVKKSIQETIEKMGCDPLEAMLEIAIEAKKNGDLSLSLSAYKELAQYVAPKRKAIELSNEEGSGPLQIKWKS
jgi:hypothetical protein